MLNLVEKQVRLKSITDRHYKLMLEYSHPDAEHQQEQQKVAEMAHAMLDHILSLPAGSEFDPSGWVSQSKWPELVDQLNRVTPLMVSTLKVLKVRYQHPQAGELKPLTIHRMICGLEQPQGPGIKLEQIHQTYTVAPLL